MASHSGKRRIAAMATLAVIAVGVTGCGGAAPTRQQLAERCGQRAVDSLSPGFGDAAFRQQLAANMRDAYLLSGSCGVR